MHKQEWLDALNEYVRAQRRIRPVPARDRLSDEEEWHCRVIGGEFIQWKQRGFRDILNQRMVLKFTQFDPEALVVVTTSMPGMVALQEILPESHDSLVYLLRDEFLEWERASR